MKNVSKKYVKWIRIRKKSLFSAQSEALMGLRIFQMEKSFFRGIEKVNLNRRLWNSLVYQRVLKWVYCRMFKCSLRFWSPLLLYVSDIRAREGFNEFARLKRFIFYQESWMTANISYGIPNWVVSWMSFLFDHINVVF